MQFIYIVSGLIVLLIGGLAFILLVERSRGRGLIVRALNMSLFLIKIPRETKEDLSSEEKKNRIAVMEQFLSNLGSLRERGSKIQFSYGQPYIVLEMAVPFSGTEISFYLAAPRKYETFLEKQVYGFYPKAIVQKVEDYNIFNPQGACAGGFLKLEKNSILPIKTYKDLEIDPLENISTALSKIEETGEGGALQIVLKPSLKNWDKFGLSIIRKMNRGQSFNDAIKGKEIKKPKKDEPQQVQPQVTPDAQETIKSLQSKISKTGFEVNIRLLFSGKTQERSEELLSHMEGSFYQFGAPNLNSLRLGKMKKNGLKKLCFYFSFRVFSKKQKMILNSEEVASIFHFPLTSLSSPKMKWLKAKESVPPINIPKEGVLLGKNIFRGEETEIRMAENDRRRHFYVIGQTGTGKTKLMINMIKQDIINGKGVCFIDPHGSDVDDILGMIPPERAEDVIYFNPGDIERPMGLNMLEYDPKFPEQKTFLANEMINIFKKIFPEAPEGMGPVFQQYMRGALLLVMDDPESGATLLEVPKVLADAEFRKYKLSKTNNIVVKDFWEKEAEKAGGEASLANIVPYITSKTNIFLANDIMRPILCQQKSSFDFRKIMDEKKIFLANLSKGKMGDLNSYLLGLIIVGKFLMGAFSRVDTPEDQRPDFYLYIDEFQNFTTDSISTILAEARKYKLNLIIAHQFIGQLEDKIKDAVFGNVGSMAVFRVGANDAEFLVKQFEPVFSAQDLLNIDNFNAYLKLLINNTTSVPFNIKCNLPAKGDSRIAMKIKELSRMKYGREKTIVDKEIFERSKIKTDNTPGADVLSEEINLK
ncbi:type IV secretion system DNA-binding domain-containing protein [Patescibacteria group bacterium]|nr:type IV secretion system DNA-binding domain-containing protein [Patescibacteria group bacterium]